MKVGYMRVSTVEQNPARQEEILNKFGVDKIFYDQMSGKNCDRPQYKEMMKFLREGDELYIESFSRLSRSTRDLLSTVDELNTRGVKFVSHKENVDTSTPQGRLMLTMFAALSEFERESLLERQREGIAIAKAEGKYTGRKPVECGDKFFHVANAWKDGTMKLKEAIEGSGLSQATFFRKCKQYGISKAVAQ